MSYRTLATTLLVLALVPIQALAHAPIAGLGSFYNGMLHPLLVPSHALLLVAAGMFFGQQGVTDNEPALATFAIAVLIGLTIAFFAGDLGIESALLVAAVVIGVVVAASPGLNLYWCSGILAIVGLLIGIDSAQETLTGKERFGSLLGSGISIYFLMLFVMGWSDTKDRQWQKIGVRIIGSWIAASSLMMLAFTFSTKV